MLTIAELRDLAAALDARAGALDDEGPPEFSRDLLARCRNDLAVILAATEADIDVLLDGLDIESFEQLRALVRPQ